MEAQVNYVYKKSTAFSEGLPLQKLCNCYGEEQLAASYCGAHASSADIHQIYLSYSWPHSTESWNLNEEKQKVITYFWDCTYLQQNKHIF